MLITIYNEKFAHYVNCEYYDLYSFKIINCLEIYVSITNRYTYNVRRSNRYTYRLFVPETMVSLLIPFKIVLNLIRWNNLTAISEKLNLEALFIS